MASTSFGIQKEQLQAALCVLQAIAQAIREFGPQGVPSGELYATVMPLMSLRNYEAAIGQLKSLGVITEDASHVLRWVEVLTTKTSVQNA